MEWLKKRIQSFTFAIKGILQYLKSGVHPKIHFVAALVVLLLGLYLSLTPVEWCLVTICIVGVWSAEAFNTAIELLADVVQPEQDEQIGKIKDISAAAVLFFAIGSLIIGGFVFLPKLIALIQ